MAKIRATLKGSIAEDLRKLLKGPKMDATVKRIADDMVAQVRLNIQDHGEPGGDWPQLSGFNERVQQRKDLKEAKKVGLKVPTPRKTVASKSKHLGYARQKEVDVALGRASHGPGTRLRATEGLTRSLRAVIKRMANRIRITLRAEGKNQDGTDYEVILMANAKGTARIPARDPSLDMKDFAARAEKWIQRLFDQQPRTKH